MGVWIGSLGSAGGPAWVGVGEHLLFDGTDTFHSPWRSVAMPESLGPLCCRVGA